MSREGEVPGRVEEQELSAEAVHDEGSAARQDDLRHNVSWHSLTHNILLGSFLLYFIRTIMLVSFL